MDRSYGTLSTIRSFFNGLKSVATIWFIPTEFLNGLRDLLQLFNIQGNELNKEPSARKIL
jgi:hypothetical protein